MSQMDFNVFKALECCRTSLTKHIANDASSLTCGHLICKECIPDIMNNTNIKCDICGETNQTQMKILKTAKTSYASKILFEQHIKSILKYTEEELMNAFDQYKGIRIFLNNFKHFIFSIITRDTFQRICLFPN